MIQADALRLARSLMDSHGLTGWQVGLDRAVRRAGATHFTARRITLSKHLVELYSAEQVRDVVLHEIAHALVGAEAGHGPRWRREVSRIGGSPRRTTEPDAPRVPPAWVGTCPGGHTFGRYRRPRATYICRSCPPHRGKHPVITWTRSGGDA